MSTIRIGDEYSVSLQGIDVATGTVEWVENGEVTIIIPQTRIVMGLSSTLAPIVTEPAVQREPAQLPDDSAGDGGAPAREMIEVPVPDETLRRAPVREEGPNPISTSNVSLRDQQLDSSVLD